MKKFAFAVAAVALTGAMAFADDAAPVAKVTGYVNSGIQYTKADTADASVTSYADDYGAAGTWGKVGATVTAANYGAVATLQLTDTKAAVGPADAYGWYSPLAGLVIDAGTSYAKTSFDGVDDTSNDYFFNDVGLGATYSINGLSLGARIAPNGSYLNYGFGVAYDLSNVGAVHFSLTTLSAKVNSFEVSAAVTAVPKLTLNGGYILDSNADNTKATVTKADLTVAYAFTDAFTFGVVGYDQISASYFTFDPYATYVVAPGITLGGYYTYYTDKQVASDKSIGSENEIKGKVTVAAGAATLAGWVDYKVAAKTTVLYAEYILSF